MANFVPRNVTYPPLRVGGEGRGQDCGAQSSPSFYISSI